MTAFPYQAPAILPGPAGFTLAEYDHNADCQLAGAFRPAWVRFDDDVAHVIPIRRDGDYSGVFYIRPHSHVRAPFFTASAQETF